MQTRTIQGLKPGTCYLFSVFITEQAGSNVLCRKFLEKYKPLINELMHCSVLYCTTALQTIFIIFLDSIHKSLYRVFIKHEGVNNDFARMSSRSSRKLLSVSHVGIYGASVSTDVAVDRGKSWRVLHHLQSGLLIRLIGVQLARGVARGNELFADARVSPVCFTTPRKFTAVASHKYRARSPRNLRTAARPPRKIPARPWRGPRGIFLHFDTLRFHGGQCDPEVEEAAPQRLSSLGEGTYRSYA